MTQNNNITFLNGSFSNWMLDNLIPHPILIYETPMNEKPIQVTRWSSKFQILVLFQRLRPSLSYFELDEVKETFTKHSFKKSIGTTLELTAEKYYVYEVLPGNGISLGKVQNIWLKYLVVGVFSLKMPMFSC